MIVQAHGGRLEAGPFGDSIESVATSSASNVMRLGRKFRHSRHARPLRSAAIVTFIQATPQA